MLNLFQWNEQQIFTFFFVFTRVASILLFLPIFGDRTVPSTVKVLFSVALAWVCFPILWNRGAVVSPQVYQTNAGILYSMGQELVIGAIIGYAARWVFEAVQFSGQVIGISMGFSMASTLDPSSESQNIALAELKYILTVMLFLALNGHHLYLSTIIESFRHVPLGAMHWFNKELDVIKFLTAMTSEIVIIALKLASPIIAVILLVNITFGLASRAVPQMNVFAVSFGANIIVGLFVVLVSLPAFTNLVTSLFDDFTPDLMKLVRLFGG